MIIVKKLTWAISKKTLMFAMAHEHYYWNQYLMGKIN